jgi:O-antigen/teichoic acid export membrane protein
VLLGRVVTAIITILSLRVMTYLLEPEDYGIYALLIAFQGFCGLFLINPIGQYINRHTHQWWDDGSLVARLFRYNIYVSSASILITFLVFFWWWSQPNFSNQFTSGILAALSVGLIVYFGTWNGTVVYILNMIGERNVSVGCMTLTSLACLSFSVILTYHYNSSVAWIFGQALGMFIGTISASYALLKRNNIKSSFSLKPHKSIRLIERSTILKYCLPLALATGLMWLQSTGYRFWVNGVWGARELGLMVLGLSISAQLWAILESLAMQYLNPYFFRHISQSNSDKNSASILSDLVNVMLPLYILFVGFNILFAPQIVNVLTDKQFYGAVNFVVIGAIIEFLRCTANLWSYVIQIKINSISFILPYLMGALIVWGSVYLISYLSTNMNSFTYGLILSGVTTCFLMIMKMQRMLPVTIDKFKWLYSLLLLAIYIVVSKLNIILSTSEFITNLIQLIIGIIVTSWIMMIFLWGNPALSRLTSITLHSQKD